VPLVNILAAGNIETLLPLAVWSSGTVSASGVLGREIETRQGVEK
jgi:hypothetical protein